MGVEIEPQRKGNKMYIEHILYARAHDWNLTNGISFNPQYNLGGCHWDSHFTDEVMTPGSRSRWSHYARSLSCEMDQTRFNPVIWLLGHLLFLPHCTYSWQFHSFSFASISKSHNRNGFPSDFYSAAESWGGGIIRFSLVTPVTLKNKLMKARNWRIQLRDDRELRKTKSCVQRTLLFFTLTLYLGIISKLLE